MDFGRFEWLSFDCYGTLVDWESGICAAVGDVLESHGMRRSRAEILALYADLEPRAQDSQTFLEYRLVLRKVMTMIANHPVHPGKSPDWNNANAGMKTYVR